MTYARLTNSKCNDANYVGTCLQCGSTFYAANADNVSNARAAALICCETPIVDIMLNDYSQCPICLNPIDYCLGHGLELTS